MNLENFLTCKFCNKKYNLFLKKPRMIFQCGHSICNICLETSLKNKKSFIICSEDKKKINLEKKTIESFPENFAILKMLKKNETNLSQKNFNIKKDKISKFKKRYSMNDCLKKDIKFDICQIHNKILEIYCYKCNKFICYKCGLFGMHNVFLIRNIL